MKELIHGAKLILAVMAFLLLYWWYKSDSFTATVAIGADLGLTVLKWVLICAVGFCVIWGIEAIIADGVAKGIAKAEAKRKA